MRELSYADALNEALRRAHRFSNLLHMIIAPVVIAMNAIYRAGSRG